MTTAKSTTLTSLGWVDDGRWAYAWRGGWVHDKLLNQHSADADVALDCMMKVQFARIVQRYMASSLSSSWSSSTGEEDDDEGGATTNENDDDGGGGGGVKERRRKRRARRRHSKNRHYRGNPSQSKHLETATMKIHGIDVDFVNLRANEVYGADSRIPTFGSARGSCGPVFGAPLEDALRRDFPINW
jgi:tRNA nucleotidyltransferase (CCA-adding enzyme)